MSGSVAVICRTLPRWPLRLLPGVALALAGCVERRLTVRTDPPHALVLIDGQEVGHSPVTVPFTYYGNRQITLIHDGYESKTVNESITAPAYQVFPLDFVTEVCVPWRIQDERTLSYILEPLKVVTSDKLLERAEATRQNGRHPPADLVQRANAIASRNSQANGVR